MTGVLLPSDPNYGESSYTVKNNNDEHILHGVHVYEPSQAYRTRNYCPYQKLYEEESYYSLAVEVRTEAEG
eukprot:12934944-Prorocentrum_lima.AAC.1